MERRDAVSLETLAAQALGEQGGGPVTGLLG